MSKNRRPGDKDWHAIFGNRHWATWAAICFARQLSDLQLGNLREHKASEAFENTYLCPSLISFTKPTTYGPCTLTYLCMW
jgi:hypothetical protein